MGKKAEQIVKMAREMYGTDRITPEQLAYLTDMLKPSTYLLRNHTIDNKPMTFIARDREHAIQHRPWQLAILNDTHPTLAVIKSRQLGISEINVGKLLHFVDTHSYDGVRALYCFPSNDQMQIFVQTRLDPVLSKGYYSTIVNPDLNSIKAKQIRNSFLYFRSSSKASAVEGLASDYLVLDEYDRVPAPAEESALEGMSSSPYKIVNRFSTPTELWGFAW